MLKFQDLNCKISAQYQNGFSFVPHIHKAIEIICLTKGRLNVSINKINYMLKENELSVVFPYHVHSYEDISPNAEGYLVFIEPSELISFKEEISSQSPTEPIIALDRSIYLSLCSEIEKLDDTKQSMNEGIAKGLATALMGYLLPKLKCENQEVSDLNTVQKVLIHCDKNYRSDISLESVSKDIGISKYYISHLFNEKIKVGFNQYINMLKINEATFLLQNSEKSITEIALEVGYSTIRSFNREFKEIMGSTPTEYKKERCFAK